MPTSHIRPSTQVWASYHQTSSRTHAGREEDDYSEIADLGLVTTTPIANTEIVQSLNRQASSQIADLQQIRPDRSNPPSGRDENAQHNSVPSFQRRSVWSQYNRKHEVNFGGGWFWVASCKRPARGTVLIQRYGVSDIKSKLALAQKLHGQGLINCAHVFTSTSDVHLVLELMNLSLVQVVTALRFPTEQEILAIVAQVRSICPQCLLMHSQYELAC